VSSLQLDTPVRGFSHGKDGPLDMQMSQDGRTAKMLIESADRAEIATVLKRYGEVADAVRIAKAIRYAVDQDAMNTTRDLANAVDSAMRGRSTPTLLSKVFQSIRIAVNDELRNLKKFLEVLIGCLNGNARIVVISYHSLEDRMVKTFFKRESKDCLCPPRAPVCVCRHKATLEVLTRRVVKPSAEEVRRNPRARSARLRAARVLSQES
jgi:16S rRNA (cytosine1402-N4)-methyltransferase